MWGVPAGCANSFNFEIFKMPGFNLKRFPYLLLRDDYGIKVFNVVSKRLIRVKDAYFGSQAGYKTFARFRTFIASTMLVDRTFSSRIWYHGYLLK